MALHHRSGLLAFLVVLSWTVGAPAQILLTTGHVDIDIGFTAPPPAGGVWNIGLHDETNNISYATTGTPGAMDWAQLGIGANTLTPRSANPIFNFIGVGAGQSFYYLPASPLPDRLFLGVGAEDNDPASLATYRELDPRIPQPTAVDPDANLAPWIRLQLVNFSGPSGGNFSVWNGDNNNVSTVNGGVPQIWMATADGVTSNDALFIVNSGHIDFNWAFTASGTYELLFRASGFLGPGATNPTMSSDTIVTFIVEPIPEPSAIALVGVALAATWSCRRRGPKTQRASKNRC
jgi:hypothetical protein